MILASLVSKKRKNDNLSAYGKIPLQALGGWVTREDVFGTLRENTIWLPENVFFSEKKRENMILHDFFVENTDKYGK